MNMRHGNACPTHGRPLHWLGLLGVVLLMSCLGSVARAQTDYSCFPNCDANDGRMLLLAGRGTRTLAGDTITMKITSPATAATVEVGIFDGESGGHFDNGNVPLVYTLYADPTGEGTDFSQQIAQWSGANMLDDAWSNFTVDNDARAKAPNGTYIYSLRIHNPDPTVDNSWSGFKVRTDGFISLRGYQSFSVFVPLGNTLDAQVIYPWGFDDFTRTTYDGTWTFYLYVPTAARALTVWDGDMDYGSYDCSEMDSDDPDTPDDVVPPWAVGTDAQPEGVPTGNACLDATGARVGGYGTGSPADNNFNSAYSRQPSVRYKIIHPDGTEYADNNPSGNMEWEQFSISTDPFDRSKMDYHADSIPAGIYTLQMEGMDLQNLNAWRFFNESIGVSQQAEVLGVNAAGEPTKPAEPYSVSGTVYFDDNANGSFDDTESGAEGVTVSLQSDLNVDGIVDIVETSVTDENGRYSFPNVGAGHHTVVVDETTFSGDVIATQDYDGGDSPGVVELGIGNGQDVEDVDFGYISVSGDAPGTGTRGYWRNHPDAWPEPYRTDGMQLGCQTYTPAEVMGLLMQPTSGNNANQMAAQLISAKLNVADGNNDACIADVIDQADAWLCENPPDRPDVSGTSLDDLTGGDSHHSHRHSGSYSSSDDNSGSHGSCHSGSGSGSHGLGGSSSDDSGHGSCSHSSSSNHGSSNSGGHGSCSGSSSSNHGSSNSGGHGSCSGSSSSNHGSSNSGSHGSCSGSSSSNHGSSNSGSHGSCSGSSSSNHGSSNSGSHGSCSGSSSSNHGSSNSSSHGSCSGSHDRSSSSGYGSGSHGSCSGSHDRSSSSGYGSGSHGSCSGSHSGSSDSNVGNDAWDTGGPIEYLLDEYNNGRSGCAPHRLD